MYYLRFASSTEYSFETHVNMFRNYPPHDEQVTGTMVVLSWGMVDVHLHRKQVNLLWNSLTAKMVVVNCIASVVVVISSDFETDDPVISLIMVDFCLVGVTDMD